MKFQEILEKHYQSEFFRIEFEPEKINERRKFEQYRIFVEVNFKITIKKKKIYLIVFFLYAFLRKQILLDLFGSGMCGIVCELCD